MGSKRNKEARVRGGAAAHLDPVLADHDVALERIQGGRCALPGLHLCTVECFAPTGSKHMRQGLWARARAGAGLPRTERRAWTSVSSIIFGWFGSASDKSTMMIFLTLANLRKSSGGSQHFCCLFATSTNRVILLKGIAYQPMIHLLPNGQSTTTRTRFEWDSAYMLGC